MDTERDPDEPRPEKDARPAAADILPTAEPDVDFVAAYAAWRIDRPEAAR